MEYFVEAVEKNNTLTYIDLGWNKIAYEFELIKQIDKLFERNRNLTKIDLNANLQLKRNLNRNLMIILNLLSII